MPRWVIAVYNPFILYKLKSDTPVQSNDIRMVNSSLDKLAKTIITQEIGTGLGEIFSYSAG